MKKLLVIGLLAMSWMFVGNEFASADHYSSRYCWRPVYRTYCPPVRYYPPVRTCYPTYYSDYDYGYDYGYSYGYGC